MSHKKEIQEIIDKICHIEYPYGDEMERIGYVLENFKFPYLLPSNVLVSSIIILVGCVMIVICLCQLLLCLCIYNYENLLRLLIKIFDIIQQ